MKYSIEYQNGKFIETLEVDNNIVTKTWQRKDTGKLIGLHSKDNEFSEQLKGLLDEDVLNDINDLFDNNMLVSDIENFIADTGVE